MSFNPDLVIYYILYAIIAYLIGSISTAIITCKLMGLEDPRDVGSKNPGATNVLRTGGKKAAIITLTGDMLKGLIPVLAVQQLQADTTAAVITGISAFLGHLYPLYFHFKGGKGVATFYGVLLGLNWMVGLTALAVWILVILLFRISALSALVSAFSSPFITWYFEGPTTLISAVTIMAVLLIWRHRSNIKKIIEDRNSQTSTEKLKPE